MKMLEADLCCNPIGSYRFNENTDSIFRTSLFYRKPKSLTALKQTQQQIYAHSNQTTTIQQEMWKIFHNPKAGLTFNSHHTKYRNSLSYEIHYTSQITHTDPVI